MGSTKVWTRTLWGSNLFSSRWEGKGPCHLTNEKSKKKKKNQFSWERSFSTPFMYLFFPNFCYTFSMPLIPTEVQLTQANSQRYCEVSLYTDSATPLAQLSAYTGQNSCFPGLGCQTRIVVQSYALLTQRVPVSSPEPHSLTSMWHSSLLK